MTRPAIDDLNADQIAYWNGRAANTGRRRASDIVLVVEF